LKVQTTHYIAVDDLREWMAGYGVTIEDVKHASIEIGHQSGPNVCAWLDVEFVKRNADGKPYAVHGSHGKEIATGHAVIPLASWPRLTRVREPREFDEDMP
jgi:hypothetical protein